MAGRDEDPKPGPWAPSVTNLTSGMKRDWTPEEIKLLGTQADADIGRIIGRDGRHVWQKRKALGIPDPPSLVRHWTEEEDQIALIKTPQEAASLLGRTPLAVKIRRGKLVRQLTGEGPQLLSLEEVKKRLEVSRYESKEQEEIVRFVDGPYLPPIVGIGGWLKCELRGELQVGGYSNALIPWPIAVGKAKQLIICGDFIRALKTESREAVVFHFGFSRALISELRRKLGIERYTAGSYRLFRRNIDLARTDEARAKISRALEGQEDHMTPEAREQLREIQKRPKTQAWRERMARFWKKRVATIGMPAKWTPEELELIGTIPDRDLARMLNRTLSSVKGKKFQLRKEGQKPKGSREGI